MLTIARERPDQPDVLDLLRQSDDYSDALYPPESRHPLPIAALSVASVRFFVARLGERAIGCGALVIGTNGEAELKRMFVDRVTRGRGVGRAVLQELEDTARREGVRTLRLETGISNHEALKLYRRSGYQERGPFGSYRADPLTVFMEKVLAAD